ncbi:MAG: histidine phosphatase family protein [Acetobacteraceae bacterium]|nr:histidine phosphatase family protein [Acetobacteraceae bacterium]MSP29818.1 histidine phosphatase family protein [Acetobacteraceae bacterium]
MTAEPILAPIPFWYLRHGETDWNAQNLTQGNIDNPLNANGLAQAHAAAAQLTQVGKIGRAITTIISSPLSRARVTADIAAAALGLPVSVDKGLREVAFGEQEGQPMGDWYEDWVTDKFTPQDAESFLNLRLRAAAALARAQGQPPLVLIVAHGALFRAVRKLMGLPPNVRTQNAQPLYCTPPAPGQTGWNLEPIT